jgi:hypothetical protein
LFSQCLQTKVVLSQSQIALFQPAIAAHQPPVGLLATTVDAQHLVAHSGTGRVIPLLEVVVTQPLQNAEIGVLQPLSLGSRPVLITILLKECTLV